jgi:Carboxypeptidase regulatory-like domain
LTGYFGFYYTDSHENIAVLRIDAETPNVTISGRVTTPGGLALRNAIVTLTDANGTRRTATTGSLGFYSFSNLPAGQQYTATISSRRYRFTPRTITADGNLTNIDFVGLE